MNVMKITITNLTFKDSPKYHSAIVNSLKKEKTKTRGTDSSRTVIRLKHHVSLSPGSRVSRGTYRLVRILRLDFHYSVLSILVSRLRSVFVPFVGTNLNPHPSS